MIYLEIKKRIGINMKLDKMMVIEIEKGEEHKIDTIIELLEEFGMKVRIEGRFIYIKKG